MPKDKEFLDNYNKYKDKIYTYLWYRLNFNSALAEDLCSEVFLKAFKNFNNFTETGTFQAWIYIITKNHLANYYRQANREVDLEVIKNIGYNEIDKLNASLELKIVLKNIQKKLPFLFQT